MWPTEQFEFALHHASHLCDHNSPAARGRELFKPFKDTESFVVPILKYSIFFDFSFFVGDFIIEVSSRILAQVTGPWAPTPIANF